MSSEAIWTPPKLVDWISNRFQEVGIPEPTRIEAERLVCHALGISRLDIYLQHDKPSTLEEQNELRELVKRRLKREPLGYILGETEFWSLTFSTAPGALIPRRETEILIEAMIDLLETHFSPNPTQILEFGTGSGVIPISLAVERQRVTIDSVEKSERAIELATKNLLRYQDQINRNQSHVKIIHSDKFDAVDEVNGYDILISNPPYIPKADIENLQPEVTRWEPREAIDGGVDGLDYISHLAESTLRFLKPGGFFIFEHGFDQKKKIIESINTPGLSLNKEIKDYSGNDRVLVYRLT